MYAHSMYASTCMHVHVSAYVAVEIRHHTGCLVIVFKTSDEAVGTLRLRIFSSVICLKYFIFI